MIKQKFQIGQEVRFKGDHEKDSGVVIGFSYSKDAGFVYQITSREVDVELKQIIEGVKTCREKELIAIEKEEKE